MPNCLFTVARLRNVSPGYDYFTEYDRALIEWAANEIERLRQDLDCGSGPAGCLNVRRKCASCIEQEKNAEIEQLQAIVNKLPVDQNGDLILPNTTRYFVHPRQDKICKIEVGLDLDMTWTNYDNNVVCHFRTLKRDSFVTREAAEAAGGRTDAPETD